MGEEKPTTPEEAKYWQAVHIIESNPNLLKNEDGLDELRNLVGARTVRRYLKENDLTI